MGWLNHWKDSTVLHTSDHLAQQCWQTLTQLHILVSFCSALITAFPPYNFPSANIQADDVILKRSFILSTLLSWRRRSYRTARSENFILRYATVIILIPYHLLRCLMSLSLWRTNRLCQTMTKLLTFRYPQTSPLLCVNQLASFFSSCHFCFRLLKIRSLSNQLAKKLTKIKESQNLAK